MLFRTVRLLFLFCCSVLFFAGCKPRETAVQAGVRTQTLHLGNLSEPNDLDPQTVDSQQTFNIVMGLFEGLAQYHPETCEPVPAGAERWDVSSDQLTWTFQLRKNARWSNGDPVTAGDYVWAYRRMLTPSLAAEYAYMLFCLRHGEDYYQGKVTDFAQVGVRAAGDHTLVLSLNHPVPYLDKLVCHSAWFPLHRATLEKFGKVDTRGSAWTRPGNFVGNGYFVLADWRPNQVVRLTRSPTYWDREHVRLNEVNFYPVDSLDSEERMFRTGQLHATSSIPIDKIAVYKSDPALAPLIGQETNLATYFYRFNVTKPPFNDVRVRRALAYAIDRRQIVERVSKGGQKPANSLTPPETAGFTATSVVPHDPERARALLAEAGYPGGKGFPKFEILFNTNEGHRQIAEAIQQMWRIELGITAGLYNQEAKVYTSTMRTLDYQVARFAWVGDYLDPSTFLDIMTSDSGNNQTGWKNAEYDRLIAVTRGTGDQAARFQAFQRCEEILADEMPIAPIYYYVRNNLRLPSVRGWYGNLLDLHPLKGVSLEP
ncbi:MAG: peptide ABC transporter substrate-binding protein [Opitutaceae bacterium]|nr:peptide ABC transporter substrate-binding protein [Opitutaceae bacterium]